MSQIELHDWRMVLEAGHAIGNFSALEWLPEIDVPTSHIITLRDPVIPVHRQLKLYSEISQANAVRIDGEHDAIVALAPNMGQMIVDGIHSIIERNINESAEVAP
jgi:3-oxoadipate enol-lactonase